MNFVDVCKKNFVLLLLALFAFNLRASELELQGLISGGEKRLTSLLDSIFSILNEEEDRLSQVRKYLKKEDKAYFETTLSVERLESWAEQRGIKDFDLSFLKEYDQKDRKSHPRMPFFKGDLLLRFYDHMLRITPGTIKIIEEKPSVKEDGCFFGISYTAYKPILVDLRCELADYFRTVIIKSRSQSAPPDLGFCVESLSDEEELPFVFSPITSDDEGEAPNLLRRERAQSSEL